MGIALLNPSYRNYGIGFGIRFRYLVYFHAANNSTFNFFPSTAAALASVVNVRLVSFSSRGGSMRRGWYASFSPL